MNTRTTVVALTAIALLSLSACGSDDSGPPAPATPKPSAPASALPSDPAPSGDPTTEEPTASPHPEEEQSDAARSAGIPTKPTGQQRQNLLDALAQAAPDVVRYEDKAIDASRNQCSAINGEGVKRVDWLASQRFTYKDVTTTEAQGAKINQALKTTGFCNT
ncbi:hypothetical protein ACFU9Y_25180 [Streptomyces sp. NPDC057621]|uniref:hypothetical protein n=1 Tax=Streptomyces sp. NPDC057621 TaxID=3346186 RepID=UPI0036A5D4A7